MPNTKNIKKVEELTDNFSKAKAIYFAEYHGLNVGQITKLRSLFFKENIEFKVVKNTLVKLALLNNKIDNLDDLLTGSTAIAIAYEEPVLPAKVIKKFTKDSDLPKVKGILFEGEYLNGDQFDRLADLPSKDELLVKFAMMLKSPMYKLASTLNGPMQNVVGLLHNLKQNKS
ncbi:MAG: 50S ribosomal protein L10 [Candidatus Marinimicrobia bacterium]|nr:50S ribosomal protein L10 [Candidatus Neomarinimicrobiota bacterium]|tara:strand:- start:1645 stop:2160 length:516 start_codon:yes stop_codon:yes gene_type:complete